MSSGVFSLDVSFQSRGNLKALNAKVEKAISMAQKDAAKKLASLAGKYVASQYWLKQKDVRKTISLVQSGIRVRSTRLGLEKYKISPTIPFTGKHLKGAVKRSGGLKPLDKAAFVWSSAGNGAYMRQNKARYPVKHIIGPAIPQIIDNPDVITPLQEEAANVFQKRFQHYISRLGGKM